MGHVGDLGRQQSAEVAGMFHLGIAQVMAHPRVDLVYARRYGTNQAAASDDRRKFVERNIAFAQRFEYLTAPPV